VKSYFNSLNERERWTLIVGAIFVVFFLLYWLVYSPLDTAVEDKTAQLTDKTDTLNWMRQVRGQNKTSQKPATVSNSQLLTLLATQLHTTSFQQFQYKLQQTGAGDIQLTYDQVPFNEFALWLWSINKKYAISIKQFNSERTDTAGLVKIMVLLSAKE
jgi:general secretion pathway protein M